MGKQRVTQSGGKSDRRLRREILRRDRADQTDDPECDQNQAHPDDVSLVTVSDTGIDHCRHNERHKKFKRRFKHFKKRRADTFFFVPF